MKKTTQLITEYLNMENYTFELKETQDGTSDLISLNHTMKNMPRGVAHIFSGEKAVEFCLLSIATVPEDKMYSTLILLNKYNCLNKLFTFYINPKDNTVTAYGCILFVNETDFGKLCCDFIYSLVSYVDSCYPEIMKTIW